MALSSLDASAPAEVGQTEQLQEEFKALSRRHPVVQFTHDGDDLIALVHEAGGTRSRVYADGQRRLSQVVGCWQLIMSRVMTHRNGGSIRERREEADLFAQLGDWLWSPLELAPKHKRVLILPDSRLTNLPWSAIVTEGKPLCEQHDLIITPSLRHYKRAGNIRVRSRKVELMVGRSNDLSGVGDELGLFESIDSKRLRVHNPCRREDWPDRSAADLWHYTGHAQLRSDNPFYSSLLLDDGPLYAADFRLKRCRVNLVTLAACRTGQQVYLPGEEMTGLVRALLEMGARSVLAGLWAVSDETASAWMHEFYRNYFAGRSIGRSYRSAAMTVREKYPSAYHWAAFAVYGAG
jgi:CHAT domain-containing protein